MFLVPSKGDMYVYMYATRIYVDQLTLLIDAIRSQAPGEVLCTSVMFRLRNGTPFFRDHYPVNDHLLFLFS